MGNNTIDAAGVSGKNYLATLNNRCYAAHTAVTGVAPGTSLGTTGAFTLYNPANSGVRMVVQKLAMGYISGTLGAGTVHIAVNNNANATAVSGTTITPVNLHLGSTNTSACRAYTTSTLPVSPTPIMVFASLQASLASTAVAPWTIEKEFDGEIIIESGSALTLHATAAGGSSPLVVFSAVWEEVQV